MASRGGSSTTLIVTCVILAALALGLLITSAVTFSKYQNQVAAVEIAEQQREEALGRAGADAEWERLRSLSGNQGVVPYLVQENRTLKTLVAGRPNETIESLQNRVETRLGEDAQDLLDVIEDLRSEVAATRRQAENAEAAQRRLQADLEAAREGYAASREDFQDARAALSADNERLNQLVDEYGQSVASTRDEIRGTLEQAQTDYQSSLDSLQSRLQELQDESAVLKERISTLQGTAARDTLRPKEEASLIDARVVEVDAGTSDVYINVGRNAGVVLGLTFEVFGRTTTVRPDETGSYPRGKATLEVIQIDETTAVARPIRALRGNPILPEDKLVNAVWDPFKEYHFIVFGNFDRNRDGLETEREGESIKDLIKSWGGVIDERLTGRTDFVVLGSAPIAPPEPRFDDPQPVLDRFLAIQDKIDRYNELQQKAGERGIPLLNENRLYTLTGIDARPD
jgi:peptidoglycan hydrolase CwlO-like protein